MSRSCWNRSVLLSRSFYGKLCSLIKLKKSWKLQLSFKNGISVWFFIKHHPAQFLREICLILEELCKRPSMQFCISSDNKVINKYRKILSCIILAFPTEILQNYNFSFFDIFPIIMLRGIVWYFSTVCEIISLENY